MTGHDRKLHGVWGDPPPVSEPFFAPPTVSEPFFLCAYLVVLRVHLQLVLGRPRLHGPEHLERVALHIAQHRRTAAAAGHAC